MVTYTGEFQCLVLEILWNEVAQQYHFCQGLSKEVKDELAQIKFPQDLDAFIDVCIHIDFWLPEQCLESGYSFEEHRISISPQSVASGYHCQPEPTQVAEEQLEPMPGTQQEPTWSPQKKEQ